MNKLYCSDNLVLLSNREIFPDNMIDLIYLDPPFNSKRDYKDFKDKWELDIQTTAQQIEVIRLRNNNLAILLETFVKIISDSSLKAYLLMMSVRLIELHRVLKSTGSFYLHCDPSASHYLKIMLDSIFGALNFRNEIIWNRHEGHSDAKRFGSVHDVILYYQKTEAAGFNKIFVAYSPQQLKRYKKDESGRFYKAENLTGAGWSENRSTEWRGVSPGINRHWMWSTEEMERLFDQGRILTRKDGKPRKDGYKAYLDEMHGKAVGDLWVDIARIANTSPERLGYPTQKPVALLERIIQASSNEGDLVLDAFCGSGTTLTVAHKLGRNWIGIDCSAVAIETVKSRLGIGIDYEI